MQIRGPTVHIGVGPRANEDDVELVPTHEFSFGRTEKVTENPPELSKAHSLAQSGHWKMTTYQ